jgi:hypothetical protein
MGLHGLEQGCLYLFTEISTGEKRGSTDEFCSLNRGFTVLRLQWAQFIFLRFSDCLVIHYIITFVFVKCNGLFIKEFVRFNSALL